MKMNYLLRNNNVRNRDVRPLITALIISLFLWLVSFLFPSVVSSWVFFIARPVWKVEAMISGEVRILLSEWRSKEELIVENEKLVSKLKDAELSVLKLASFERENVDLKSALGRNSGKEIILSAVLARPGRAPYDSLIIDAGAGLGVKVGDEVSAQNFVIGAVAEVFQTYSKVPLYSSPGLKTNVRVGDSGVETEATGKGGGNMSAKISNAVAVSAGDLIKKAGVTNNFFGSVKYIEEKPTDSFKTILFSLPVNIYTLEWVEISK